jgi:hypothetical protein
MFRSQASLRSDRKHRHVPITTARRISNSLTTSHNVYSTHSFVTEWRPVARRNERLLQFPHKRSHMPEEWCEPIQNFASLGSKAKNEAKFFE